jgi:hypothetical protein
LKRLAILFVLTVVVAASALANRVITLTFEGLKNDEPVNNYYDGGFGGAGSGPGPDYGITFTSDSLALIASAAGGSGNFSGEPSMATILFFDSGAGDTMNVAAGFTTGFSFYYSSPNVPGSVQVYSGLNGTGTVLATVQLPQTPDGGAGCAAKYCPFEADGVTFDGTAESVLFGGSASQIGFDNITLGAATPTDAAAPVPEPATVALLGGGIGVIALRRRFHKA